MQRDYSEAVHPARARAIHPHIVPLSSLPDALASRCAPLLAADGLRVANVSNPHHRTSFLMAVRGFSAGDAISTTIAWRGAWEGIRDARELMAPRHTSDHHNDRTSSSSSLFSAARSANSSAHQPPTTIGALDRYAEMHTPIPSEVRRAFAGGQFPRLPPHARPTFV